MPTLVATDLFGAGSDPAPTLTAPSVFTLPRDMYYPSLTVPAGVTVLTNGYSSLFKAF